METPVEALGKWYATDPLRYYQIVYPNNKVITHYKMYVTKATEEDITYDSFILFEDGQIQPLKVDKVTSYGEFKDEVKGGYLSRDKAVRNSLDEIGNRYGINITAFAYT